MPEMPTAVTTKAEISLEGIIDYAGLYPPADLDMDTTVQNWAQYLSGDDGWMLSRLIIPASRLDEFKSAAQQLLPQEHEEPWQLSILLPPAASASFSEALESTIAFNQEDCGAFAHVIEFKATSAGEIDAALTELHDDFFPFVELPIDHDPRGLIAALSGAVAGAKVRTGGVRPELYPTPENLARFIHACANAGLPFKTTAGMHHPLKNYNERVGVEEFGFLSVLNASAAAIYREATIDNIEAMLQSETTDCSVFQDDELAQVRAELFCSVGSCSFIEAREDLIHIGLLKEQI